MAFALCLPCAMSCEKEESAEEGEVRIDLPRVAEILASLPIGSEQIGEVHDAVSASCVNGYDEEYTMSDLFASPGAGVGDRESKSPAREYSAPIRDLISDYLTSSGAKASGGIGIRASSATGTSPAISDVSPERYLSALAASDVQIYWPFSEKWDGASSPTITYDPGEGYDSNVGYRLTAAGTVEEVNVDLNYAETNPVWVVNRNDDAAYTSLEMLRRSCGGGTVTVKPVPASEGIKTRTADGELRTLVLKEFTAKRSYDPWFAGASEFFVKCGSVEDFSASTEAELKLYSPSITDFMIVVRRGDIGKAVNFDAVLVSDWSDQLESCGFMITEDDGGTQTSWKCTAEVKVKSKTYGFDISLPFRTRDDIVWRGQLSARYLEKYSGKTGHYGDIDLRFDLVAAE